MDGTFVVIQNRGPGVLHVLDGEDGSLTVCGLNRPGLQTTYLYMPSQICGNCVFVAELRHVMDVAS